jgi:bacillithiol system protein YtxJ
MFHNPQQVKNGSPKYHSFMKSKFPSQSLTINTEVVLPNDTNHVGNLFGGKLMQWVDISAAIAERLQVHHESPQIIILRNGECIYDESHQGIRMEEIVAVL